MDPRQERRTPFLRVGRPLRAVILAVLVALVPVAAIAAGSGQGSATKVTKGITVTLSPSSRSIDQGLSVTYTAAATSTGGFNGPVTFAATGLPAGTSATWSASSVNLSSGGTAQVTLTVSTSPTTPAGKTDFTVSGTSGSIQSSAPAQLQVQEVKRTFGVTGSIDALAPGISRAMDLQMSNSTGKSIAVSNLSVAISQVVRTPAAVAAGLPCSTADYAITQFSGTYPLTIPNGSSSLSGLGVAQGKWPQVKMLDTLLLQDGCKGATLQLTFSGTGQAN